MLLPILFSFACIPTISSYTPVLPKKNPVGIQNCGVSCFMNSTLQAIITMNQFTEYLITQETSFKSESVSKALINIFELYNGSDVALDLEIMQPFYNKVTSTFFNTNIRQEDAIEFWDLLYQHLIDDDLQVNELKKIDIFEHIEKLIGINESESKILQSGATVKTELILSKIMIDIASHDPYRQYINNIQEGVIQKLFEEEGASQFTRNPIGVYLVAALNIFKEDDRGNRIKIKEKINLNEQIQVPSGTYNCIVLVCHSGETINSGHYVAYVKRPAGWFFCNDEDVTPKGNFTQMLAHMRGQQFDPYLLFFGKIDRESMQVPAIPQQIQEHSTAIKKGLDTFSHDLEILPLLLL